MTNTAAALEAFAPELAARFVAHSTRLFNFYVERYGQNLRGIANSSDYTNYSNSVRPFIKRIGVGSMNDPVALNTEYLAKLADQYAADTVAAWAAKIDAKLGELEDAKLARGAGMTFLLHGRKNGRAVTVEQTMIVNISPKGTLFNQFPARIYIDGKFTSAKAFAAL